MHFENPQMLWLLSLGLVAALLCLLGWLRKKYVTRAFGEAHLVAPSSELAAPGRFALQGLIIAFAVCAVSLALARPVLEQGWHEFPRGTVDVVAVVDVSRSMAAEDYRGSIPGDPPPAGTRLNMARHLRLGKVMDSLSANRLGIVTFAGHPFTQAFLTDDIRALRFVANKVVAIGSAPGEGSHLAWALARACRLFDLDSPANNRRIVIVFSDGGMDDKPEQLAAVLQECKKRQIEFVILGLGRRVPSPILAAELNARDRPHDRSQKWYQMNGQVVKVAMEEKVLKALAARTSGSYSRVEASGEFDLTSLVSSVEMKHRRGQQELFFYPLLLAVLLVAFALLATNQPVRELKLPRGKRED